MYSLATLVYCLKWVFSNNTLSYLFVGLSGFAIFCGDQGSEGWEDRKEIQIVSSFYPTALSRKMSVTCFPTP